MMDDSRHSGQANDHRAGLCGRCVHVQIIRNDRGSQFYLCRLSLTDPRFPRYPAIPVVACAGYEAREEPDAPVT
jgi:hypothetical protein